MIIDLQHFIALNHQHVYFLNGLPLILKFNLSSVTKILMDQILICPCNYLFIKDTSLC